jgi:hypothetical protein
MAQGSYLNLVSKKFVKVFPSRKATLAVSIVPPILLEGFSGNTYGKKTPHRVENRDLLAGLEALFQREHSSSSCLLLRDRSHEP